MRNIYIHTYIYIASNHVRLYTQDIHTAFCLRDMNATSHAVVFKIIEGQFPVFERICSSKHVLKTVVRAVPQPSIILNTPVTLTHEAFI